MQSEIYVFTIFIFNGILIGLFFDIFRVLRKNFKTPDFVTYFEDAFFGIIAGLLLIYSIMKFNNGEMRIYIFIGVFLGFLIYLLAFSNTFITINSLLIQLAKKIIYYVVIVPVNYILKFFRKIIFKPIIFMYVSIKNKTKKIKFPKISFKKTKCKDTL